jgi:tetratricopeptide (TPR) repeat protein
MPRFPRAARLAAVALAAMVLLSPSRAAAGVAESWYLSRGRANMKIANYSAAIEAYEKVLEGNAGNREASRSVGLARLHNGETDRAVAAFDRHLARFPDDPEIAFEQARILQWSRYAYRAADAVKYLRMGLAARDDPARRRDLARLLGRDRATLDEALAQYDRLLAASPRDAALRDERLRLLLWDPRRRAAAIRELEAREREAPDDERVARDLARLVAEDPARADEAVARHERLLARRPDDPDLRLGHARALARAGRRREASVAYAHALRLRPSLEARLERAELLAADAATRDAARAEFEEVLRTAPRSRRARMGLARVLGARKETSAGAIVHYEAVLREVPRDAEAHRGLARAHAWNGDPDRALAHGALAERYGRPAADVVEMERSLRRGREPALAGGVRALAQPGSAFRLSALKAFASGRAEPTPFTSSWVEGGVATYRGDGAVAEGAFVDVKAEWRPGPEHRLRAGVAWDGARLAGRGVLGELRYEREDGGRAVSVALARRARQDSFRAHSGEVVDGRPVGAASDEVLEARLAHRGASDSDTLALSARAGTVRAAGMDAVFLLGADARADRALLRRGAWTFSAGAAAEATHHARDVSGLRDADPTAPRLFSPPLFLALSPRLGLVRDVGHAGHLALDVGPALQLTAGPGGGILLGGDARLSVAQRLHERLRIGLEGRAERVAAVHERLELTAVAAVLF